MRSPAKAFPVFSSRDLIMHMMELSVWHIVVFTKSNNHSAEDGSIMQPNTDESRWIVCNH